MAVTDNNAFGLYLERIIPVLFWGCLEGQRVFILCGRLLEREGEKLGRCTKGSDMRAII